MSNAAARLRQRPSRRAIIEVIVIGLALYIILAGLAGLRASILAISSAHAGWLVLAALAVIGSYVAATITYLMLSLRRLRFVPTLWVELASCLVNRLLPGGLGGLGINALYLKKQGQSLAQASVTVASNNLLGFVGNIVLLVIVFKLSPIRLPASHLQITTQKFIIAVTVVCLLVAGLLIWKRAMIGAVFTSGLRYGRWLMRRPLPTSAALLSSMSLTTLHGTALFCVLQAIHYPLAWPLALIAVSAGSLAGGLVPTPGGLGGAEAGIAGALISVSVPAADATAAALIYRGLTYWLPLLPGYLALKIVEKRYL